MNDLQSFHKPITHSLSLTFTKPFSKMKMPLFFSVCLGFLSAQAQLQVDQTIELTGPDGSRSIEHLESPVNPTDAVNKAYVDAAVAASGGGVYASTATMMSNESASDMVWGLCLTYCRDLEEGGFDDWRMATVGDLVKLLSTDGYTIPQNTSANWANILIDNNGGMQSAYPHHRFQFSVGYFLNTTGQSNTGRARCVR